MHNDLNLYIGNAEDRDYFIFNDKEFNDKTIGQAVEFVRGSLFDRIKENLEKHNHREVFNRDGTMRASITNEQAMQIAKDVPLSSFLMDKEQLQGAMSNHKVVLEMVKQRPFLINHASPEIQSLVGNGDPVEILTKAIASEKLSARLTEQLKLKVESKEQSMKMKI